MSDFGPQFDLGVNADEGEAKQAAQRLANIITKSLEEAFSRFSADFNRTLVNNLTRTVRSASEAFDDFARETQDARAGVRGFQGDASELGEDIDALRRRTEAFRRSLDAAGADPELFAIVDRELRRILRAQREFNADFERLANDRGAFNAFARNLSNLERTTDREVAAAKSILQSLRQTQQQEADRLARIEVASTKERIQNKEFERSQMVALTQQETTIRNAEIRSASAEALQTDRRTARVRIELLRFTLRQARTIERSIGTIFRTSAAVIAGAFARIENTVFRIGRVFRRSNTQINDGLSGALLRRERTIDRSFDRQTREIRSSVTQQERIIQRFQTRASTGLTGAVTGRSGFGALLGGGLAFGGGFLLIDRLRAGFDEAVNLNEALNKTRQIFREASGDIEEFATGAVENLFITQSAALEAASNFGIFGKAAGLTGPALSKFSKDLTVLATDLASFNNTTVDDAITALAAALRGESEPIRRYGVLLNEATLQNRALELGIIDTTRKLQPFERVLAANAEIFAQTIDQQGDAARTADDFANSSRRAAAASVETAAAIAGAFVPIAEFFTNFSFRILPRLTDFIEGSVGPGLQVLRDGLIGAGAALASLVAARGAVEVLQFLAIALRAVATPVGLFVTAVAGLGAAINILRRRSASFDEAIRSLVSAVRSAFGEALSFAFRQIERLAELIGNTVIPIITRFVTFIAENLRTGLEIVSRLFSRLVIPAVQRFAQFIRDDVVPFVVRLAEVLGGEVLDALRFFRDLAVDLFETVQPFIQPAIDGFIALGDAILGLFLDRDISGLLDGVVELAKGIGGTFVNVGEAAIDVLRPQLERVLGFITGFFTRDRLLSIAEGFLVVVERIGYILGRIVSDPRFVGALAAIVAAAAITAFRFVRGFAEGIIDNLDDWKNIVVPALKNAFNEAIERALDPKVFGALIASLLIGTAVLTAFRRLGAVAADTTVRGYIQRLETRPQTARNFVAGLFGGENAIQAAFTREGARQAQSYANAFDRRLRDFQRLGITPSIVDSDRFPTGEVTKKAVQDIEQEWRRVGDQIGQSAVSARLFRQRVVESFGVVGGAARGFGQVLRGDVRGGFRSLRAGAVTSLTAIGDGFNSLVQSGRLTGQRIGTAILGGLGAVFAGQALGQGQTLIGLGGILASSLTAGLATGSPFVAAAVAGVGLITAKIVEAKEEAKRFKAEVDALADAILEGRQEDFLFQKVLEQFNELDASTRQVLIDAGFNIQSFVDRLLEAGAQTDDQIFFGLIRGLEGTEDGLQSLFDLAGRSGGIENALQKVVEFQDVASRDLGFDLGLGDLFSAITGIGDGFESADLAKVQSDLDAVGLTAEDLLAIVRAFGDEEGVIAEAILQALDAEAVTQVSDAIVLGEGHLRDLERAAAERQAAAQKRADRLKSFFTSTFSIIGDAVVEVGDDVVGAVSGFDLLRLAAEKVNQVRLDTLNDQLDGAFDRLGAAREATQLATEALFDYFNPDQETREGINAVITRLDSNLDSLTTAISKEEGLTPTVGVALREGAEREFADQVEAALRAAIQENPEITFDELKVTVRSPLLDAIEEVRLEAIAEIPDTLSPEERAKLESQINQAAEVQRRVVADAFNQTGFESAVTTLNLAQEAEDQIREEIAAIQASIKVDVELDTDAIIAELEALGIDASQFDPITLLNAQFVGGEFLGGATPGASPGEVLLAAQQQAQREAEASRAQAPQPTPFQGVPSQLVTIETINITETGDARTTGVELSRALAAAAASRTLVAV